MEEEALNIIIGTIYSIEKVEKTDKLFLVKIDAGDKEYQIATSLASFFKKQDLIGQQVPIKVDVKPREIWGVVSNARFIAVMGSNKEPVLLIPQIKVPDGAFVM